jgi:hypothetical protein|tara:strand:- start:1566 stop:2147 length:582 start_codon:yes stop_codon:yes gene_type:complete
MEPIDVYLMYCAMKAHFGKSDYDFVTYKGKTRIKRDTFYKRKDRSFFVRLSRKYKTEQEITNYFVANFIKDKKGYIANFNDENFDSWKLKRQGFFDLFEVEMKPLVDAFEDLFKIENGQHPKLMKEFLGGRVSLETLIILDELVNFDPNWNRELEDDIIWIDLRNLMDNYERFLTIDQEQYKIRLLKLIEESS